MNFLSTFGAVSAREPRELASFQKTKAPEGSSKTEAALVSAPPKPPRFAMSHAAPPEWRFPSFGKNFSFGHPCFAPEWGRVTRGFDADRARREWQAEQILRRFGQWPPPDDEVYLFQIDQDSPPPPPPPPRLRPGMTTEEFRATQNTFKQALNDLNAFLTSFSGQSVVFRAQWVEGRLRLVELNPDGPLRSASHPGQLDPMGQASCNDRVCGMAWLRSGIYPYKAGNAGVYNPVQDSLMDVARDMNFDGAIDGADSTRSARAFGFAIQIHAGFPGSPRSVGCQTLPPADFATLQRVIAGTGARTFNYVLVRRPNERFGARPW